MPPSFRHNLEEVRRIGSLFPEGLDQGRNSPHGAPPQANDPQQSWAATVAEVQAEALTEAGWNDDGCPQTAASACPRTEPAGAPLEPENRGPRGVPSVTTIPAQPSAAQHEVIDFDAYVVAPGYQPEALTLPLQLPCEVRDAEFAVSRHLQSLRLPYSDVVIAADPQPCTSASTFIVLPPWTTHAGASAVVLDLTRMPLDGQGPIIACFLTRPTNFEEICREAGLYSMPQEKFVFIGTSETPLRPGELGHLERVSYRGSHCRGVVALIDKQVMGASQFAILDDPKLGYDTLQRFVPVVQSGDSLVLGLVPAEMQTTKSQLRHLVRQDTRNRPSGVARFKPFAMKTAVSPKLLRKLRTSGSNISLALKALYQLFLKASLRVAEPIQFKGGSLFAIWKGKSSTAKASAYRGILVSSVTGKSFHRAIRNRSVDALRNFGQPMQTGGLPSFPVTMGSHFVRLFQAGSHRRRRSHGLLFLDLREAFYRVVRPLLAYSPWGDEDFAKVAQLVRLPPEVMHELHVHLGQRPVLSEAGTSAWTTACMSEALVGTWFRFQGGEKVVRTDIGSRPGDNLADVCFSFIFAKVLQAVQADLQQLGILPEIPWANEMLGNIFSVGAPCAEALQPLDATWMDDASFLIASPNAGALAGAMEATGRAVVDACASRALLPNLDRGKTEFIACALGPGSRKVRATLFAGSEPKLSLHCRLWPSAQVRLVPTYQHLGGFIHHDASLSRELKHRVGLAWKSFNARRKKIFGAPGIARRDKVLLYESLILTVLLYGAGTWDTLQGPELAILETAYHGMACYMLRPAFTYEQAMHMSRSRVLSLLGLPSIPVLLHVARLRHLLPCITTSVPVFWGILHWQESWLESARQSISWLWEHIDNGVWTRSWQEAWSEWKMWCLHQPRRWKGAVRRGQLQAVLQERWRSSERHHHGLICRQLRSAGAILPPQAANPTPQPHFCAPCGLLFTTYQEWSVHAFKSHGHTAEYRQVQSGTQCQACLKHFPTHVKLCRHLQYHPCCRQRLQEAGHGCRVEPGIGSKRAPDDGRFQAPSLQAQGPLLPFLGEGWQDYLERPSVEVIECLRFLSYGLDEEALTESTAWERVRVAFSSVCLPIRKIQATARIWLSLLDDACIEDPFPTGVLRKIGQWILTALLAEWLVPSPVVRPRQACTFRDAPCTLPVLDVSALVPRPVDLPSDWVVVRVGAPAWLENMGQPPVSTIDFTFDECFQALHQGGVPSFMQDVGRDTVFVISVCGLPPWHDCPTTPTRGRAFGSLLDLALLAGDLIRFALRLWLLGVPTALCTDRPGMIPTPIASLCFLRSAEAKDGRLWYTKAFNWEPLFGFTS
ncbi:unnamed protein product [Symbiodinium sp. CCMP2456]|nr:unnamed protein product [Symbiodinium sp. CCMP2456]